MEPARPRTSHTDLPRFGVATGPAAALGGAGTRERCFHTQRVNKDREGPHVRYRLALRMK
jgi:hypothetical protein